MIINNELDMFQVLLEKAEKKAVDKENGVDFYKGIEQLQSVLSFVKMKTEGDYILFERGFDVVKVKVGQVGNGEVILTYEKNNWFTEKERAVRKAQEEAIREYSLW